jgi:hypothetical protein
MPPVASDEDSAGSAVFPASVGFVTAKEARDRPAKELSVEPIPAEEETVPLWSGCETREIAASPAFVGDVAVGLIVAVVVDSRPGAPTVSGEMDRAGTGGVKLASTAPVDVAVGLITLLVSIEP